MEELMELLDDKIFTDEIKQSIVDEFNKAVEKGVENALESGESNEPSEEGEEGEEGTTDDENSEETYDGEEAILNDITKSELVVKAEAYTKKMLEEQKETLITKADEYTTKMLEEQKETLITKADEYTAKMLEETQDKLDTYLNEVVENILESYEVELQQMKLNEAKVNALAENFDKMVLLSGVELKQISEDFDNVSSKTRLSEAKLDLDKVIVEKQELKSKVIKLQKEAIFSESVKDLTIDQIDKVKKLSESFDNKVDVSDYKGELGSVIETIVLTQEKETKKVIVEDKKVSHNRFF